MNIEIDPRLKAFESYIDDAVATQDTRPYGDRVDIKNNLRVYHEARQIYEKLVRIAGVVSETPLKNLDFSLRAHQSLEMGGVRNLRDLTQKTEVELLHMRSFGMTSLREVKRRLNELGLSLRKKENS